MITRLKQPHRVSESLIIHDIEIEVDNLMYVNIADPLQDLLGEDAAGLLREHKLVLNHPVKKLPASDAAMGKLNFGRRKMEMAEQIVVMEVI